MTMSHKYHFEAMITYSALSGLWIWGLHSFTQDVLNELLFYLSGYEETHML